ncbi:MAG: transposase family protein [Planctomycetes bacterium]|nr:transposase family protein [Planctomycetota bacterium]
MRRPSSQTTENLDNQATVNRGSASETGDGAFPEASREAKRLAAAILEVLAGTQAPAEAARALGISVARYYQLELRGLSGLVTACEGRRRGRGPQPGNEVTVLRRECEQLRRECGRHQALVRAARRSVGLAVPTAAEAAPKRIRRRPTARALKMAAQLRQQSARTIKRWLNGWRRCFLGASGRGRPAQRSDRHLRNRALALIDLLGPRVGVPTMLALCPEMARREMQDLLRRYRRVCKRRRRLLAHILHWHRPGAVWAIDFAQPPEPVHGCYPRLLAVRDLASGCQLLWLPVADESEQTAMFALQTLFRQYGPPLVLKSDNGSAFITTLFATFLNGFGVWQLFSPPRFPSYNGSCEAGIGSMKTRSHHQAARRGQPGQWTCDDVEAARLQANETARPWGHRAPTPDETWQKRTPIQPHERAGFATTVEKLEKQARQEQGHEQGLQLDRTAHAAVMRVALRRALAALGLLSYTSEYVPEQM